MKGEQRMVNVSIGMEVVKEKVQPRKYVALKKRNGELVFIAFEKDRPSLLKGDKLVPLTTKELYNLLIQAEKVVGKGEYSKSA